MIEKNNRKLKGTDSNLNARRLMFERVRSLWSEKRGVWCAVDFEAWDLDHRVITEFGWSAVSWNNGEPVEDMGHLIVSKHRTYTNHYVPENRRVSWAFRCRRCPELMISSQVLSLRPVRGCDIEAAEGAHPQYGTNDEEAGPTLSCIPRQPPRLEVPPFS